MGEKIENKYVTTYHIVIRSCPTGEVRQDEIAIQNKLRDWSLITGRGGGLQKWEGAHVKFYPYEKGGRAQNVLAMLKGGHNKFWGSFYVVA